MIDSEFWKGKRVLVTGHTGFKGGWLSLWLHSLGCEVAGYALPNQDPQSFYAAAGVNRFCQNMEGDILDAPSLGRAIALHRPELIFHLAAQPLVRRSYAEPLQTYMTNVIGTLNLFESARQHPCVRAVVNITTDKCYENHEDSRSYREGDPLGGYDPYSSSKACSEIMTSSYRRSYLAENGFLLASARAGNVIGGGDWALDRLVPDCIRALSTGQTISLRNKDSVRPWQFVMEPLWGYILLGAGLLSGRRELATAFNFGPDPACQATVAELCSILVERWGSGTCRYELQSDQPHEAGTLLLDSHTAQANLGWTPRLNAADAIARTVDWYARYYRRKEDMADYSFQQIAEYMERLPH